MVDYGDVQHAVTLLVELISQPAPVPKLIAK
jgi:hypothetical protein